MGVGGPISFFHISTHIQGTFLKRLSSQSDRKLIAQMLDQYYDILMALSSFRY
jgi:hypothetical protein